MKEKTEKTIKAAAERLASAIKRVISFVKAHKKGSTITACAATAFAVTVVLICILSGEGNGKANNSSELIAETVPAFSDFPVYTEETESFTAVYYENVTIDSVNEYTVLLEQEFGIVFNGDKYPRSAEYKDKIIVIHYNVTDMRFSVTVVRAEE